MDCYVILLGRVFHFDGDFESLPLGIKSGQLPVICLNPSGCRHENLGGWEFQGVEHFYFLIDPRGERRNIQTCGKALRIVAFCKDWPDYDQKADHEWFHREEK